MIAAPAERGYAPLYHQGEANHCPGCHRSHWHVGRVSSECAFCGVVLPFAVSATRPLQRPFTVIAAADQAPSEKDI